MDSAAKTLSEDCALDPPNHLDKHMSETRESLLKRVRDLGDDDSWEEFDSIYRPLLMRYARARGLSAEESEEIAQQCMASVVTGIQNFQRRVSFRGWLHGMIDNKVNDQLRKRKREIAAKTADFDCEETREGNPALLWERQWNRTHLLYCLNQIRNEIATTTYDAFEMYVIEEKPVAEIAERLGMTPNQVYVAKHRVMARIKKRWDELADGIA
jgi:RNA polymerase sigma factor (sigma-70 family)